LERLSIDNLLRYAKFIHRGAESDLYELKFLGKKAILKWRRPKPYRLMSLDEKIRGERVIKEVYIMVKLRSKGLPVPSIFYACPEEGFFIMEEIEGCILKEYLTTHSGNSIIDPIATQLGEIVASIHEEDIVHGDLTTSNVIINNEGKLTVIDFGLSIITDKTEEKAADLDLLYRVLMSTHTKISNRFFNMFIKAYMSRYKRAEEVYRYFKVIQTMGRYIPKEARYVWH